MQHNYVGDITDFFKYFLLRRLEQHVDQSLAINWYVPGSEVLVKESGKDGKKIKWVEDSRYQELDPELYTLLKNIVNSEQRSLKSIEQNNIFRKETVFYDKEIPFISNDVNKSRIERGRWFTEFVNQIQEKNIVFLDPDNGFKNEIIEKNHSSKHVIPSEIIELHKLGKSIILINFRDRSPSEKYMDKLYSIAQHIGKAIPIYSMRVRKHGFRDFIFIPQENTKDIFEEFYRSMSQYGEYFELVGISSGKFFTMDTFHLEIVKETQKIDKRKDLLSRRFSEEEQKDFDEFYDHEFHDEVVSGYQKLLKNVVEKIKEEEGMKLNEQEQEMLEYHIMKAAKLFMLRYFNL